MPTYNTTKNVSMLVCFAGCNRRVVINTKKCTINKKDRTFTYKTLYKTEDGKTYLLTATSVNGSNGLKADVIVSNKSGKEIIAKRHNVDVRFGRYMYE